MPTADALSTRVLRALNVVGVGETPTAAQLLICFEHLNDMIDSWGVERLTKAALLRTVKTLASGTASYTIGSGGAIAIVRPVSIEYARLILDSGANPKTEVPIKVFSDQDWADIFQKDLTSGRVQGVYYDYGYDTSARGTIFPWPVPDVGTMQLVLYTPTAIVPFADQTATTYTFAPGIVEALRLNLQCRVHSDFAAPLDPKVERLAGRLLQQIKIANVRPKSLKFDGSLPGTGARRGDIRRGY